MRAIAGLRNILVQGYMGVNREIILGSAKRLPEDTVRLADQILSSANLRVKNLAGNIGQPNRDTERSSRK